MGILKRILRRLKRLTARSREEASVAEFRRNELFHPGGLPKGWAFDKDGILSQNGDA